MRLSILTSFLFCLAARAEQPDIVVYHAKNRPAEELKNAASGLMNGGRASVSGESVVVIGTSTQRAAMLKLFTELDQAHHNYLVSLRSAGKGEAAREASGVTATAGGRSGSAQARNGVLTGQGSGTVAVGTPAGRIAVGAESQASSASEGSSQQLSIEDGGTGRIYVESGLFPRTVTVSIRSIRDSGAHVEIRELDANVMGKQAIVTELDVPLGEWRALGGYSTSLANRNGEMFGHARRSSMSGQTVQVKVDVSKD